jgi:hypothetical protein
MLHAEADIAPRRTSRHLFEARGILDPTSTKPDAHLASLVMVGSRGREKANDDCGKLWAGIPAMQSHYLQKKGG